MKQRRALLARIERRFRAVVEPLRIGGHEFDFARVADPDDILWQMEQPYWAQIWDSNRTVAERLLQLPLAKRRVLDLGCGLGLTGCVAAACGADVLLADAVPAALLFARWNTWPWGRRTRIRRVDWRTDRLPQTFDWIVGSDILYDTADWPFLEAFWRSHLAPGGRLLLGEPGRETGIRFPAWLTARGWLIREESRGKTAGKRPLRLFLAADPS